MKATISTDKTYSINIGGATHSGFRLASSWEGFSKYVRGTESVIVAEEGSLLDRIFGTPAEASVTVLKASPSLLPPDTAK